MRQREIIIGITARARKAHRLTHRDRLIPHGRINHPIRGLIARGIDGDLHRRGSRVRQTRGIRHCVRHCEDPRIVKRRRPRIFLRRIGNPRAGPKVPQMRQREIVIGITARARKAHRLAHRNRLIPHRRIDHPIRGLITSDIHRVRMILLEPQSKCSTVRIPILRPPLYVDHPTRRESRH